MQRVAVAGHAQRKGHQQRIEAGRRIQDANLQAAEMQGILHIHRQEKINAGHQQRYGPDKKRRQPIRGGFSIYRSAHAGRYRGSLSVSNRLLSWLLTMPRYGRNQIPVGQLRHRLAVNGYFHGPGRANRTAQLAGAAFIRIENHFHFRSFDIQRPGGADCRAGAALIAALFIALYFTGHPLDPDAGIF